jgi:Zn-dependent M28 family amino/carboxypeptidase
MSLKKISIKLSGLLILSILITIFATLSNATIGIAAGNKNEDADNDYTLCLFNFINCVKDSSMQKIEESEEADELSISSVIDQVNYTKLRKWVDVLSSFHTRHTKSGYIEDAAYWLKDELQGICKARVYFHNFTQTDQGTDYHLKNIVCDKKGLESDNLIIISAHYDSRMQDINNTNGRAPGADDNASGVSAILELARILSQIDLKNNIQFVLFSGEEQGQWGSKNYVKYLLDNNRKIDLQINADMIGYPPPGSNKVNLEYDWGNKVTTNDMSSYIVGIFMKQIALEYTKLNTTLTVLSGNSDYRPFEAYGYTVIGVHDEGVEHNPNYHSTSDTPDTLDLKYLSSITKLLLATILELDELSP